MISKYNEEVNKNASLKRTSTSSNNNVVAATVNKRRFIVKGSNTNADSAEVSKENNKQID